MEEKILAWCNMCIYTDKGIYMYMYNVHVTGLCTTCMYSMLMYMYRIIHIGGKWDLHVHTLYIHCTIYSSSIVYTLAWFMYMYMYIVSTCVHRNNYIYNLYMYISVLCNEYTPMYMYIYIYMHMYMYMYIGIVFVISNKFKILFFCLLMLVYISMACFE